MRKQKNLFEHFINKGAGRRYARTEYGGSKKKGRNLERPLSTKKWIHMVLKSDKAKGELSFLNKKNRGQVEQIIEQKARKFGVRVAELVNVGNHIHFKIRIASREMFQKFLKAITALIARKVTGAKRGNTFGRFWEGLAYTRVLLTSLEEWRLRDYLEANRVEAAHGKRAREAFVRKAPA